MLENAAIVRREYEAFDVGDLETLTELFDENAEWHTPGQGPLAGDAVGRDESSPGSAATRARRTARSRPRSSASSPTKTAG